MRRIIAQNISEWNNSAEWCNNPNSRARYAVCRHNGDIVKTLRIAVYVLAAVALLPFAFSQELLKLAPFGRPIAVMDEADNWSIPISLYSDSEVEMFVPDITTEGWIAWHIKQFRETGKYGVYVYTFFKNDQFCRRERIPAEDKTDPKWLEGCSALRYQRKLLEVDTRKNTVRVYSVLVMQKDAVANPMNQKVFNVVFPLVKLDSSQRQAYHRLSAIVTREMNEYKGMSVEESVRQTSKVVSNMMENLTNGAVCPETGNLSVSRQATQFGIAQIARPRPL